MKVRGGGGHSLTIAECSLCGIFLVLTFSTKLDFETHFERLFKKIKAWERNYFPYIFHSSVTITNWLTNMICQCLNALAMCFNGLRSLDK